MIARRRLLLAGAALALLPREAFAGSRLSFGGSLEQGGLVVGRTVPDAKVGVDGKPVLVSPGGLFAFGLAYDQTKLIHVTAAFADGSSEEEDVVALARQYMTQSFNGVPENTINPSPEEVARIEREHAVIAEIRKRDTDGVGFADPFDWPFPGIITSPYGYERIINGTPKGPHLGIDIAAPEGTPIHAAAQGVVTIADDYFLEGGLTLLDHGHGVSTCYLHQSERKVKVGDQVARGDVIGLVGQTGRATGPHTHWGLTWFQVKLDPSRVTRTPAPPPAEAQPGKV